MAVKFVTQKGSSSLTADPFYIALVQHERTMSKKEAYDYLAGKIGYSATAIRASFLALKKYIRENAERGNITCVDEVASFRNVCKGAFETLSGPWVRGVNYLIVNATALAAFKSALAGIVPTNNTEGAKPAISSVLDETTGIYDVISGTDEFAIAGTDLGPDTENADEYVALISAAGVETKCTVTSSDLQTVKARLASALAAGEYTLAVYTRSGLGTEFGVKCATRKVVVG